MFEKANIANVSLCKCEGNKLGSMCYEKGSERIKENEKERENEEEKKNEKEMRK